LPLSALIVGYYSSVVVSPFAAGYIAPKDTSPDAKYQTHHNLYYSQSTAITLQTTSTTTCLQPSRCRRPPQPACSHRAADDLSTTCLQPSPCRRPLHNLSTAIALQTTSTTCLQPSPCRRPLHNLSTAIALQTTSLQPVYNHRAADDLYHNRHHHHNILYNTAL